MLILLDIDGVLLPAKPWISLPILGDNFYAFNPKSVDVLNEIVFKSKAKIILTTSHKHSFSIDQWITIFNNRGVKITDIDRLPDNIDNLNRREEIEKWISEMEIPQNFIIIDDDKSLNDLPKYLKNKLILTQSIIGLTSLHLKEAVEILHSYYT